MMFNESVYRGIGERLKETGYCEGIVETIGNKLAFINERSSAEAQVSTNP